MGSSPNTSQVIHITTTTSLMIQFMLLFSRQGKPRLQKWFSSYTDKTKKKLTRDLITNILGRGAKMSSFIEWSDMKIVYKRYASLYFCCAIENTDNELITLEIIHNYVVCLTSTLAVSVSWTSSTTMRRPTSSWMSSC